MENAREKLIQLLKEECTLEWIKKEMNVTSASLAYRLLLLKNMGYTVGKKYYGNGDITAYLEKPEDYFSRYEKIYTKKKERELRILILSDLHYFHKKENRKAIDTAFNYCVKNNIHIILICGDLIDCMEDNVIAEEKEVEQFLKLYPKVDGMIHFCVLGNHDIMPMKKYNIDFKRSIENKRLDIVPIHYLDAGICIKNDKLFLNHPIHKVSTNYKEERANCLNFIGHSHVFKVVGKNIYVPSLSDVKTDNPKNFCFKPQALDATIRFSPRDTFQSIIIDQIMMETNPYIVGEHRIHLNNQNKMANDLQVTEYPSVQKVLKK